MKNQRKQYAPDEKAAMLRRHLPEKEPISMLCEEAGLQADSSTAKRHRRMPASVSS